MFWIMHDCLNVHNIKQFYFIQFGEEFKTAANFKVISS